MGELRATHFHAGLDIKTGGKSGVPIYSSDEGFIWRIKVSSSGYGKVLYIKHKNNYITVYAHLQQFSSKLEEYTIEQQYQKKSYAVDLSPISGKFKVQKGEIIAWSGNTGASSAPHLHFEIRDSKNQPVDPLYYFYFPRIKDDIPPKLFSLGLFAENEKSHVSNDIQRKSFSLVRRGKGKYRYRDTIYALGNIRAELYGFDTANGVHNKYGINKLHIINNDTSIFFYHIKKVPFSVSRQVNLFTNYSQWVQTGKRFIKCYIEKQNRLPFEQYEKSPSIFIEKGKVYHLELRAFDSEGNLSTAHIFIKGKKRKNKTKRTKRIQVIKHYLSFLSNSPTARLVFLQDTIAIKKWSKSSNQYVFLWDLRKGIPLQIERSQKFMASPVHYTVVPDKEVVFKEDWGEAKFFKNTLYDTLYLSLEKRRKRNFSIGKNTQLLRNKIELTFYFNKAPLSPPLSQWAAYRNNRYLGGQVVSDTKLVVNSSSLGNFHVRKDSISPRIKWLGKNKKGDIQLSIRDRLSGIKTYTATINKRWLLMSYDPKNGRLTSIQRPSSKIPLKGELFVLVEDQCGNRTKLRRTIQ